MTISKSITPAQVVDNDRVTYTFVIQNSGNQAVVATDNAAITDTFDPILTALAVTFDGAVWTQGVQYNYNAATGLFTTVPGQILVPAATYAQDPVTGETTVVDAAYQPLYRLRRDEGSDKIFALLSYKL